MKVHLFIIILFARLGAISQSVDSLKLILDEREGADRIGVLHHLCIGLWLNNPNEAMGFIDEALKLSQEANDSTNIVKSFRLKGGVYYYQGDFESSQKFDEFALVMSIQLKDSVLINSAYNNVGLLQYNLGNYQTALEYFLRSIKMKLAIGETYGLATVNNMGLVFERVGDYETARKYFLEAYQLANDSDNDALKIYTKNNLGTTFLKENQLKTAEEYFRKALLLANRVKNVNYGAVALRRIGEVRQKQGYYDSARIYFDRSLEACQRIEERRGISEIHYLIAKLEFEQGRSLKALNDLNSSHEIAIELKLRQQLLDNLKLYSRIHHRDKNFENSLINLSDYITLSDSLFKEVMNKNLALVPIKIQEEEDKLLLAKQEIALKEQHSTNRFYVIILIITGLFVIFLGFLARKIISSNRILRESNQELQRTQKLLITSEKMASLGLLATGIGHEINNPLNFIKNGSVELSKLIRKGNHNPDSLEPYFLAIDEGVNRASSIVKSLSHFSRVGVAMDEKCDLLEILENCLVILSNNLKSKAQVIRNYSSPKAVVLGNGGKLHQAFLNILTNAEHAIDVNGIITISSKLKRDEVVIEISDNGEGIAPEHLTKISDPFFTTKAPGVGVGLGLFVTHSIIEEHKGKIEIDSSKNRGTSVKVTIPKNLVD